MQAPCASTRIASATAIFEADAQARFGLLVAALLDDGDNAVESKNHGPEKGCPASHI